MIWGDLEARAPEIARLGKDRIDRTRIAFLGTVRRDGSPRISPVEPYLSQGHLLFGTMTRSLKTADLLRNPRCVLHSTLVGPESGEGELKVYGRAVEAADQIRNGCQGGWWLGKPRELAVVFSLDIDQATFVSWDLAAEEMTIRQWSRAGGYATTRRHYP
jgi:pyridoxamine 5'-phosphate oxidase-like protein